jgi:hypothetical protein
MRDERLSPQLTGIEDLREGQSFQDGEGKKTKDEDHGFERQLTNDERSKASDIHQITNLFRAEANRLRSLLEHLLDECWENIMLQQKKKRERISNSNSQLNRTRPRRLKKTVVSK